MLAKLHIFETVKKIYPYEEFTGKDYRKPAFEDKPRNSMVGDKL